jgi:hypothetical protein
MSFAIGVVFNERGFWSKSYTYESDSKLEINDIVVVPTQMFYGVGKVVSCMPAQNYKFNPKVNYKKVIRKIDL